MKECKCTVIDEKVKVTPNLKGLQIKVGMNFCVVPKRAKAYEEDEKIEGVNCQTTSNILIIVLNDMFYGSFSCSCFNFIMSKKTIFRRIAIGFPALSAFKLEHYLQKD